MTDQNQTKALVLCSGGVDSTTCVSVAVEEFGKENVSTVFIFYGQKHRKELECARKVADYFISQVQEDWVPRCDFRQPEGDPLKDACVRWTKAPPTGATASPPSSTSAPAPTTARATTTTSP